MSGLWHRLRHHPVASAFVVTVIVAAGVMIAVGTWTEKVLALIAVGLLAEDVWRWFKATRP